MAEERLARRLKLSDAVFIGLGSMIGAGIFAVPGPAAEAAGSYLLVGLGLAAIVAYANATSSAQLAAVFPESGGTYVYAREQLSPFWGFLAGWGFVIGKTASLGAMALTFGAYAYPPLSRPIAVAAVVILTAINYRGVQKTARAARILVLIVLVTLAAAVAAILFGGSPSFDHLDGGNPRGVLGVLESAGLLFFAFAGYARIATLGEEVIDPEVTIPRAIPIALGIVVIVYAAVLTSALVAVGPDTLARSTAPLAAAVEHGRWEGFTPIVRIGAALAAAGVLLSLLAGVSRTAFSMARRGDLPRYLDAVHARHKTPHHAELVAGLLVVIVVSAADLRGAIGFSSFAVLIYYALTNASALTLRAEQRRWPRPLAWLGLVGCVTLAFTLPHQAVIGGVAVLGLGSFSWLALRGRTPFK